MPKILLKLGILVGAILLIVLLLGQLNFKGVPGVEKSLDYPEHKLGEVMLRVFDQQDIKIESANRLKPLQNILDQLCAENDMDCEEVNIHLFRGNMVNAFALPGGNIVIYTGLIQQCETAEELAGVIAHELAHIKLDHIRRKLMREVGLSMIGGMVGGSAGSEMARQTALLLANTSYGRQMELEADEAAVNYLMNAGINPNGLASLLSRITAQYEDFPEGFYWFSTHPETGQRVRLIREKAWDQSGESSEYKDLFQEEEWEGYLDLLKTNY